MKNRVFLWFCTWGTLKPPVNRIRRLAQQIWRSKWQIGVQSEQFWYSRITKWEKWVSALKTLTTSMKILTIYKLHVESKPITWEQFQSDENIFSICMSQNIGIVQHLSQVPGMCENNKHWNKTINKFSILEGTLYNSNDLSQSQHVKCTHSFLQDYDNYDNVFVKHHATAMVIEPMSRLQCGQSSCHLKSLTQGICIPYMNSDPWIGKKVPGRFGDRPNYQAWANKRAPLIEPSSSACFCLFFSLHHFGLFSSLMQTGLIFLISTDSEVYQ